MATKRESFVDLLIIGAGPAGMMAAAWANQYQMSTRIIDKNHAQTAKGQADGLQARTLEIFDSFGIADQVWRKGFHDIELNTWLGEGKEGIKRSQRVLSQKRGISRFSQTCINQAVIEQTFVDHLSINGHLHVERNVLPEKLLFDRTNIDVPNAHPVVVDVQHLYVDEVPLTNGSGISKTHYGDEKDWDADVAKVRGIERIGCQERIKAKYLLACDGAHSWTRRQLDLPMEGEQTDFVWGVMDIIPLSDFQADMRQACAIHSATAGSILNVPREDRINRLYIQLGLEDNSHNRDQITPKVMLAVARRIMAPYTLDYKHCDWWSLYKIGQRMSPKFSVDGRIFLAGDAVHTHSPKLGQGMNVSMQDTYNLGWKLGAVITGTANPSILQTYETERRQVALDLLQCDREIARFYARQRPSDGSNSADPIDFSAMRESMHEFLAGVGITYPRSLLVQPTISKRSPTSLATKMTLGARIPSHIILNQAEARPLHLADLLKSDSRWRLLVFAGDIKHPVQAQRIRELAAALSHPNSFLHRYTPSGAPLDSVIEVLTIHASPRIEVSLLEDLPEVFHPWDGERGWDYWKVFVDDEAHHEGFADVYGRLGISRLYGCLVVCRPDQHVGFVGAVDDVGGVEQYLGGILVPRKDGGGVKGGKTDNAGF